MDYGVSLVVGLSSSVARVIMSRVELKKVVEEGRRCDGWGNVGVSGEKE